MLKRVGCIVALMVMAAVSPVARADDSADAKKAVENFVAAWKTGDAGAMKATLVIAPQKEKDVTAVVEAVAAISRMQKAAEAKFGAAAAAEHFASASTQFDARLKGIKEGTVKLTGDSAILTIAADESARSKGGTIVLIKTAGNWKIDAASMWDMTAERAKQTADLVAISGKLKPVANQLTKEINDGKYTAAIDAYQEFMTRFQEALKEVDTAKSETGPASRP